MLYLEAVGQQRRRAGSNVVCFAAAAEEYNAADVLTIRSVHQCNNGINVLAINESVLFEEVDNHLSVVGMHRD